MQHIGQHLQVYNKHYIQHERTKSIGSSKTNGYSEGTRTCLLGEYCSQLMTNGSVRRCRIADLSSVRMINYTSQPTTNGNVRISKYGISRRFDGGCTMT